jgi:Ca2+-binding RTX toxin-like protein
LGQDQRVLGSPRQPYLNVCDPICTLAPTASTASSRGEIPRSHRPGIGKAVSFSWVNGDTRFLTATNVVGETFVGGNGGQTHTGTGDDDNLTGGNGKDVFNGGAGNDTLTGGNGADTLVFAANFGEDVITDFKPHQDVIQFDHTLFANFAAVQSHATNDGQGNTVITFDANDTITLLGVTVAQLHASDFLFI